MRSTCSIMRVCILWLGVACLSHGSVGAAEEGSAARSDPDALAAARRQLDALKADASSRAAGVTVPSLPSISVPRLSTSADAPAAPLAPPPLSAADRAKLKRQREAENWLIEGVRRQERADAAADHPAGNRDAAQAAAKDDSATLDPNGDPADDGTRDPLSDFVMADDATTAGRTSSRPRGDHPQASAPSESASDPLAKFMEGWLSPNDPLRKVAGLPSGDSTPLPGSNVTGDPSVGAPGSNATLQDFGLLDRGAEASASPLTAPADNPFLSFTEPAPPPPDPAPALPPSLSPAPPMTLTPTPAESASKSSLPDFVRPDDDDKYFKPLKRF